MLPFMMILSIPYHLGLDAMSANLLEWFMGSVIAVMRFFTWGA